MLLLLLAPGPLLAAGSSSMGAQVQVFRGLEVETPVPTHIDVGSEATATDSRGEALLLTEGQFTVAIVQSEARLELPVTLSAEGSLQSFNDPASGITVENRKVTIPVKSADGVETMTITADVERVQSEAAGARVVATNVLLTSKELSVDFSGDSRTADRISVSFEVQLKSLPQNASATTSVSREISLEARRGFEMNALLDGKAVAEIGAVLTVEKTNLEGGVDLGSAQITMKIGRDWVNKYGQEKIKILRYGDRGDSTVLDTSFAGYEGDQAVFRGASPNGLSSFALTALIPLRAPFNWLPIAGGVGGSGAALAVAVLLLRRIRRRESSLRDKWPTGLRREDWRPERRSRGPSR